MMQKLLLSITLIGCSLFLKGQPNFVSDLSLVAQNNLQSIKFNWNKIPDQAWLGYSFWCNSYLDWKVENNRVIAFPFHRHKRTAHYSAQQIKRKSGLLKISVTTGFSKSRNSGHLGLLIGAGSNQINEKTNLLIHNNIPNSNTHLFAINKKGVISLSDYGADTSIYSHQLDSFIFSDSSSVNMEISYKSLADSTFIYFQIRNTSTKIFNDTILLKSTSIPLGSIALFYSCKKAFKSFGWFDDLRIEGNVLEKAETTGPLLSSFHTITDKKILLTVQLQPFEVSKTDEFELYFNSIKIKNFRVHYRYDKLTHQIRFKTSTKNLPGKVNYTIKYSGKQTDRPFYINGTINTLLPNKEMSIMALNCNGFPFMHEGKYDYNSLWYPYEQIEKGYHKFTPNLVIFLGDQFYESRPSAPIIKEPFCYLDYLYKWNLYCLQFRNITANTPTIILTDDHDVYQGNLWGNGGVPAKTTEKDSLDKYYQGNYDTWQQDNGGYFMPKNFVNMAIRSQTSHLPKPYKRRTKGLSNYYTSYQFGDFDFAILEDKKYKSAPVNIQHQIFNGIPLNNSLTNQELDNDNFKLLGKKQLKFLKKFVTKESDNLKIVLTQSAYASLTTINKESDPLKDLPSNLSGEHKLNRDMDTNGWPKTGRDKAMNIIGTEPVLFLCGDQHMGSVVELFDTLNNGTHFFTIPSISNTWQRTWLPSDSTYSNSPFGIHYDGFGNKMNVIAVANPTNEIHYPQKLNKKSPGFGIIILNSIDKTAILHAYPLYFNEFNTILEYNGWPINIDLK